MPFNVFPGDNVKLRNLLDRWVTIELKLHFVPQSNAAGEQEQLIYDLFANVVDVALFLLVWSDVPCWDGETTPALSRRSICTF